jgi:hypothetical protein
MDSQGASLWKSTTATSTRRRDTSDAPGTCVSEWCLRCTGRHAQHDGRAGIRQRNSRISAAGAPGMGAMSNLTDLMRAPDPVPWHARTHARTHEPDTSVTLDGSDLRVGTRASHRLHRTAAGWWHTYPHPDAVRAERMHLAMKKTNDLFGYRASSCCDSSHTSTQRNTTALLAETRFC